MSRRPRSLKKLMFAMAAPAALIALAGGLTQGAYAGPRLALDSSPARINFGAVTLGNGSTPVAITYTNRSASPVKLESSLSTTGDTGDFGPSDSFCAGSEQTLAPGASCTMSFFFNPQATGHRTMTLYLLADGTSTRIAKTVFSGRGVAP